MKNRIEIVSKNKNFARVHADFVAYFVRDDACTYLGRYLSVDDVVG